MERERIRCRCGKIIDIRLASFDDTCEDCFAIDQLYKEIVHLTDTFNDTLEELYNVSGVDDDDPVREIKLSPGSV